MNPSIYKSNVGWQWNLWLYFSCLGIRNTDYSAMCTTGFLQFTWPSCKIVMHPILTRRSDATVLCQSHAHNFIFRNYRYMNSWPIQQISSDSAITHIIRLLRRYHSPNLEKFGLIVENEGQSLWCIEGIGFLGHSNIERHYFSEVVDSNDGTNWSKGGYFNENHLSVTCNNYNLLENHCAWTSSNISFVLLLQNGVSCFSIPDVMLWNPSENNFSAAGKICGCN